jgi:hypothetical protein
MTDMSLFVSPRSLVVSSEFSSDLQPISNVSNELIALNEAFPGDISSNSIFFDGGGPRMISFVHAGYVWASSFVDRRS